MEKKDKNLVSIITPSYNQGRFIEDTLLSVKNQDYPNIEHIIMDGGSTDETIDILRTYEGTYNMRWVSEPDKGQSDAINKGWKRCSGEIVGWVNSDDVYFDKTAISYVVKQFKSHQDADVIYGDNVAINKDNLILRVRPAFPRVSYGRLLRTNLVIQSATFFRRKVVQENSLKVDLDFVMDYEYWLRLTKSGVRFKHVNRILSALRVYEATKSYSRREEMANERMKVREKYGLKLDTPHRLLQQLDSYLFMLLKMYNVGTVLRLHTHSRKGSLAFPGKFDSLPKAMFRQLSAFN